MNEADKNRLEHLFELYAGARESTPRIHCQFCSTLFTPPSYFRAPSLACDRCWLEIQARLVTQPEPGYVRAG